MLNVVVIMGRLTDNPELKTTNSGVEVTSFSVAVERRYVSGGERQTDFINVVAWRQQAKFVCNYFRKGQMIAVNGTLQQRSYTDRDGNKRTVYEVVADNISFCGSKAESAGDSSYSAPAAKEAPASFSNIDAGDFEEIAVDDGDYPF